MDGRPHTQGVDAVGFRDGDAIEHQESGRIVDNCDLRIARRIEQISEDALQVNQGTIYLCLIRLVQQGWVVTEWGVSDNNRRAKFYAISKSGRKQLVEATRNWERVAGVMGRQNAPAGLTQPYIR